jgi:hypothetical protein
MKLDLNEMKIDIWKEPGRWGERITISQALRQLLHSLDVNQSVQIEHACDMNGNPVSLKNVQARAYQKFDMKLFSSSLPNGGPLTITRIA